MKTALVIGATGLVGLQLVRLLVEDARFGEVRVFARRPTGLDHAKLVERIVDFERLDAVDEAIRGDVLFSSLGTTLRQSGSQAAQYRVDYTYQHEFARRAAQNGVGAYVLVSSAGASVDSLFFYMRMKGELERDVRALPFPHIHILQPGYLDGQRREPRPGEALGLAAMRLIGGIGPLRPYRPIPVRTVAQAMIALAFDKSAPVAIHPPASLFSFAQD